VKYFCIHPGASYNVQRSHTKKKSLVEHVDLIRNYPYLVEPESLLLSSQKSTTRPYSEADVSISRPCTPFETSLIAPVEHLYLRLEVTTVFQIFRLSFVCIYHIVHAYYMLQP